MTKKKSVFLIERTISPLRKGASLEGISTVRKGRVSFTDLEDFDFSQLCSGPFNDSREALLHLKEKYHFYSTLELDLNEGYLIDRQSRKRIEYFLEYVSSGRTTPILNLKSVIEFYPSCGFDI